MARNGKGTRNKEKLGKKVEEIRDLYPLKLSKLNHNKDNYVKVKKQKSGDLPAISTASLPDIVFMLLSFHGSYRDEREDE
jgi:hypothetical protein